LLVSCSMLTASELQLTFMVSQRGWTRHTLDC
jgi:hypothetical protein